MVLAHTLDGHGPDGIVMLHDWLGDSGTYAAAMPYFDMSAFTCARVDLPGYGASRARVLPGLGAAALDVEVLAVADQLGWSRFHLVGHSMSTVVAQRLARALPARVASLTLIAPVTPGTRLPDEVVEFLRAIARHPQRRAAALAASAARLSPQWLAFKLARWAACAEPAAVAHYVDLFARPDLAATRADIAVPVLAITGADDAPPFARAAVEAALRVVYPEVLVSVCPGGHYPMQEAPPLFATVVERFLRSHPIGARAPP